ncbi:hypothetical protein D1615_20620 [Klebsiella pneumoniae]|nr:hypothetical protein C2U44_33570 [Klebsiella oxytoca]KJM96053.1 hypothetical protein SS33_03440 [Enterobacter kobei]MBX4658848.1 hypothetical protein [Klebsiella michiganensis]RIU55219.1 hypothetical protein D1615_20620 [Klebsiella pneumoniae]HBX3133674.1 hypothetical protein [Klebsiella pneumoniae]
MFFESVFLSHMTKNDLMVILFDIQIMRGLMPVVRGYLIHAGQIFYILINVFLKLSYLLNTFPL